jgi:hypothetical protein
MEEMLPPGVTDAPPKVPLDRAYAVGAGALLIVACLTGVWVAATPHPLFQLLLVLGFIPASTGCFVRNVALTQQRGSDGPLPFVAKRWFTRGIIAAAAIPLILATWYAPIRFAHPFALLYLAALCSIIWRAGRSETSFERERARPAARLDRKDAVLLGFITAFGLAIFAAPFWVF